MSEMRWRKWPEFAPPAVGRYLVTTKKPSAGKWIDIRAWNGVRWTQGQEIAAWMPLPSAYGGVELGRR